MCIRVSVDIPVLWKSKINLNGRKDLLQKYASPPRMEPVFYFK